MHLSNAYRKLGIEPGRGWPARSTRDGPEPVHGAAAAQPARGWARARQRRPHRRRSSRPRRRGRTAASGGAARWRQVTVVAPRRRDRPGAGGIVARPCPGGPVGQHQARREALGHPQDVVAALLRGRGEASAPPRTRPSRRRRSRPGTGTPPAAAGRSTGRSGGSRTPRDGSARCPRGRRADRRRGRPASSSSGRTAPNQASSGVSPASAPSRQRPCRKYHRGAHPAPQRLVVGLEDRPPRALLDRTPRKSAWRRTLRYRHRGSVNAVRAPQTSGIPRVTIALTPRSTRACASPVDTGTAVPEVSSSGTPAGAAWTPRSRSVRAMTPATWPVGGTARVPRRRSRPPRSRGGRPPRTRCPGAAAGASRRRAASRARRCGRRGARSDRPWPRRPRSRPPPGPGRRGPDAVRVRHPVDAATRASAPAVAVRTTSAYRPPLAKKPRTESCMNEPPRGRRTRDVILPSTMRVTAGCRAPSARRTPPCSSDALDRHTEPDLLDVDAGREVRGHTRSLYHAGPDVVPAPPVRRAGERTRGEAIEHDGRTVIASMTVSLDGVSAGPDDDMTA